MEKQFQGALSDITVLDMTRVLSGPFAGTWLGEMGANVIKIEIPKGGDESRRNPPFNADGTSAFNTTVNRNKRSITLDLKSEEGKEIFRQLVKKADVVLENFRPDVMDRLGLGYEELKKINDQIIYASISGFGTTGPYAKRPAYDVIAQAMGGIMFGIGEEGGEPLKVGASIGDVTAGMNVIIGILAALHARSVIGHGQKIETSLVESIIALQQSENNRYFVDGEVIRGTGSKHPTNCPYGAYHAADGMYMIGVGKNEIWCKLCENVLGHPEYGTDPRFDSIFNRIGHKQEICEILESWSMQHTVEEVVEVLLANSIPAAPLMSIADLVNDPHFNDHRNMFPYMEQPGVGPFRVTAMPIKFSETGTRISRPAPALGAHNEEVYGEMLGFDAQKLAELKEKGII
ncbi:MAG: CoA transferase [Oscillospiraceae bacterium]|nr:CoA transferase [Oscillospiraceae bacterium]